MYGITQETKESNFPSPINAGIQDNIYLESVKFESITEGQDPILTINLRDEFGGKLRELIYPVNEEQEAEWAEGRVYPFNDEVRGFVKGEPMTPEGGIALAYDAFNQRLLHIASKYVDKDKIVEVTGSATSYEEFAEAYASLFTQEVLDAGNPTRWKLILNNKDYTSIPRYVPFVESMEIPREQTKLEIRRNERVEKVSVEAASNPEDSFDQATF